MEPLGRFEGSVTRPELEEWLRGYRHDAEVLDALPQLSGDVEPRTGYRALS